MKRLSSIKCILLIATLLFSQLSSAFELSPLLSNLSQNQIYKPMQDCEMGTMSSAGASMHAAMMDMYDVLEPVSVTELDDTVTHMNMDCCDKDTSIVCCDTDCQCSSFIASVVFISQTLNNTLKTNHINAPQYYTGTPPQPYLHQPKRPPIRIFS